MLSDEFDGSTLDTALWCTRLPFNQGFGDANSQAGCNGGNGQRFTGNNEQQFYVDTNTAGQATHELNDGVLSLNATKTREDPGWDWVLWESGMIRTKQQFAPTAGHNLYLTARMKLPDVKGSWPAFWLYPGYRDGGDPVWPPEIDIIDAALNYDGDNADMLHMDSIEDTSGAQGKADVFHNADYDNQWHNWSTSDGSSVRTKWVEVGLEWSTTEASWYVDGTKVLTQKYKWQQNNGTAGAPATVILNLAVGGSWAGRNGVDITEAGTSFDIDHVRIYQQ